MEEVHQDDATLNKQIVKNKDHHVSIEILQSFSINSIQLLGDAQVEEKIDLLCITITVSLFAKKLLVVAPPTRDLPLLMFAIAWAVAAVSQDGSVQHHRRSVLLYCW